MDESYEWDAADFSTQPGAQDGEHFVFFDLLCSFCILQKLQGILRTSVSSS